MSKAVRAQSRRVRTLLRFVMIGWVSLASTSGCADFFNPSFLSVIAPSGEQADAAFLAVEAPVGHVPILFRNTARMADNVFQFVIQADSVVRPEVVDEILIYNPQLSRDDVEAIVQAVIDGSPVDLEEVNLPPRVRLTVDVTNVNGGVQQLEFLDGLRLVRQETGFSGGTLPQDLTGSTNDTFIVQCDITQITIVGIDVFIPVVLRVTRNIFNNDGQIIGEECFQFLQPQFVELQQDEAFDSGQGEFQVLRNYDPRFFPPPLTSVQCGTVVVIELTGDLSLPFRDVQEPPACEPAVNPPADGLVPGYLDTDQNTQNQIPGRYGVRVIIQG